VDIPTILYWGLVALGLLGGLLLSALCWQLRRSHPVEWKDLGSPSLLFGDDHDFKPLMRFLNERRFVALGDEALSRLSWVIIGFKWTLVGYVLAGLGWIFWPWKS